MRTTTPAGQLGFTLGETLTALAVVGIGLSLAAPGLQALTTSNRQTQAVNQLVSTMHLARSEAAMRNSRVTVCASTDGTRCDGQPWEQGWIAFLDTDGDSERAPSEALVDRAPALQGMRVRSAEYEHAFTYRPNGRVATAGHDATSGEFLFCKPDDETAARIVIVRANGLPALSDRQPDGSLAGCPRS